MWMAYSVPHKFGVFLSRTRRKHAGSSSSSSFYHGHAAAIAARPSRKSVCVRQERFDCPGRTGTDGYTRLVDRRTYNMPCWCSDSFDSTTVTTSSCFGISHRVGACVFVGQMLKPENTSPGACPIVLSTGGVRWPTLLKPCPPHLTRRSSP